MACGTEGKTTGHCVVTLRLELALVGSHLLGCGLHNPSFSRFHFRWGHNHLQCPSSTLHACGRAGSECWGLFGRKGGLLEREMAQARAARPCPPGPGTQHRQCWVWKLRGLSVPSPEGKGCGEGTRELAAYRAAHTHLQHGATGDSRPPAPSAAMTRLSHPVLQQWDTLWAKKTSSASFCASVSLNWYLIPQSRIRKRSISLQELETREGKTMPCSFAWLLRGWKIWEERRGWESSLRKKQLVPTLWWEECCPASEGQGQSPWDTHTVVWKSLQQPE